MKTAVKIVVGDYHDFKMFKPLEKMGIKVRELGCAHGNYIGIAYQGMLADPENAKLFKELKKLIREEEA